RAPASGIDDRDCRDSRYAACGHPHRGWERCAARHCNCGSRRADGSDRAHLVRVAVDVSHDRALGRGAQRPSRMARLMKRYATIGLLGLLSGCAAGPDFKRPAPPKDTSYGQTLPEQIDTQRFVVDQDIPAEWWEMFQSPKLNRLIEQALTA